MDEFQAESIKLLKIRVETIIKTYFESLKNWIVFYKNSPSLDQYRYSKETKAEKLNLKLKRMVAGLYTKTEQE